MVYPKAVTPDTKAIPGKTFAMAIALNVFVELAHAEDHEFVCIFARCDERQQFVALCNTARPEYVEQLARHLRELFNFGWGRYVFTDRETRQTGGIYYFDALELHNKLGDLCYRLS